MKLFPKGTKPIGEASYFSGSDRNVESFRHELIESGLSDVLWLHREHGFFHFENSFGERTPVVPSNWVVILNDGSVTTYDDLDSIRKDYEVNLW